MGQIRKLRFEAHLIENCTEFCPDKAVDEQVDGRIDDEEYVREEPGNDDDDDGIAADEMKMK